MARFSPLFSGSSGNSYYIGSSDAGILVDAGRSAKQLTEMLGRIKVQPQAIQAILVTHEHIDHVRGLRVFASRHHIPVFATTGTLRALEEQGVSNGSFVCSSHHMQPFTCAGVEITPFPTSHDCAEGCGYKVRYADGRTLAVATDLGCLSEAVKTQIIGCDFVVLESNHDPDLLRMTQRYSASLKARILGARGHLSNEECAKALLCLAQTGVRNVILGHLSQETNNPELAFDTVCRLLKAGGIAPQRELRVDLAWRDRLGGYYEIR